MKIYLLLPLFLSACVGLNKPNPLDEVDHNFQPVLHQPIYAKGLGPIVAIDEYHNNYHKADGRYLPFAKLMRQAGYQVEGFKVELTPKNLTPINILVIANAISNNNLGLKNWVLPNHSAFSEEEIEALYQWVEQGGSLLLIADHMPFPGAAMALAARFGLIFHDGFAENNQGIGVMTFSQDDNSLHHHPIVCGRQAREQIKKIKSFYGQAFRVKAGIDYKPLITVPENTLLKFSSRAWEFSDKTPSISAVDMLQGATLQVGKGRVAVFGEAAMFAAQIDPDGVARGMNDPEAKDNMQFALNTLYWLSGGELSCDGDGFAVFNLEETRNE